MPIWNEPLDPLMITHLNMKTLVAIISGFTTLILMNYDGFKAHLLGSQEFMLWIFSSIRYKI